MFAHDRLVAIRDRHDRRASTSVRGRDRRATTSVRGRNRDGRARRARDDRVDGRRDDRGSSNR